MLLGSMALALVSAAFATSPEPANTPHLSQGFQQMYNLDFPAAHDTFHAYQQLHREDPMGYVSNAAAYLFSECDHLHILQADLFTDDHAFEHRSKPVPDPEVKTQFEHELSKGDASGKQNSGAKS